MEFFDSGQNFSIANISMGFFMRSKGNNVSDCYTYPVDGNVQGVSTKYNSVPMTNLFLRNFSKSNNKSDKPLMFQNNIKEKFENFTRCINSRESNIMKDTMDQWNNINTGYSELLTSPRGYSYMSNSVASYLIGGFVGSKSQMNNEKHKLSFDLGEFIFKILHDWKCDKDFEKTRDEKKFEVNKINKKQKSLYKELSEKFENDYKMAVYNSLLDRTGNKNIETDNCMTDNSNQDQETKNEKETQKSASGEMVVNETCIETKHSPSSTSIGSSKSTSSNVLVSDNEPKSSNKSSSNHTLHSCLKKKIVSDNISSNINSMCPDSSFKVNGEKCCDEKISRGSLEIEKQKFDSNSASQSVHCSPQTRTRQYSECSIESTDSESFIVFDDKCDSVNGELHSQWIHGSENDESDFNADEDYDCDTLEDDDEEYCWVRNADDYDATLEDREIAEANARWSNSYKDVVGSVLDENERKVRFSDKVEVHRIIAWDFAYRAARLGPWEQMARDRDRFRERIQRVAPIISAVLMESHRKSVYDKLRVV